MPSIPRPHLSSHLSLSRVKSATGASSTTPNASRDASPSRSNIPTTPRGNGAQLGEQKPVGLVLRLTVVKGKDLAPKDKSGTSDPFVVVTVGDAKEATSVVSKTLNPEWNQTFEIPIANPDSALLEAVCWDKDRFRNDYMGEFDILLEDIFTSGTPTPEPRWTRLEARRGGRRTKKKDTNVSGEILIKFALYDPTNLAATPQQILNKFYGIVADSLGELEDEDPLARVTSKDLDDVSEAEEDRDPSDETDEGGLRTPGNEEPEQKQKRLRRARLRRLKRSKLRTFEFSGTSDVAGVLFLEINRITDLPPEKNMTRTSFDMDPFVVTSLGKKTYRTRVVRHNLNPVFDEKLVFPIQKSEQNYSLNFAVVDQDKFSNNDFVGTAIFPVEKVRSLAPEADPVTGLYRLPDPDAPEGEVKKKKWRVPLSRGNSSTNLSRLSRNSSHSNLSSKVNMTSSNSSILGPDKPGIARQGSDPVQKRPPPPTSEPSELSISISGEHVEGTTTVDESGLSHFELPLDLKNKSRWEDKHSPVLYLKAKYLPYQALRQQFWRALIKHYDADESGSIDKIEMVTMLDTLGSTLHNSTIDGFFHRFKDVNAEEVLTYDQAVICLEEQLEKTTKAQKDPHRHLPWRSKKDDPTTSTARLGTLNNDSSDSSPTNSSTPHFDNSSASNLQPKSTIPTLEVSDLSDAGEQGDRLGGDDLGESDFLAGGETDSEIHENGGEEHVVEIQECPICHQPRLQRGRRNTDADIITHIATCASGDWRAVNNLVMAGFVTSSQAQRKWYSKVISKVSYGGYRLGANSANILVQDRITGMINEERMSVYVRLGIRLLYKGLKSRDMEKKKVRKLLRSLSFKQGRKYDDPASAAQIPGFINFHQLDMGEVLLKTEEFKTFNEFFYRKLKPDARPCSAPNDPHIVVSPADCRTVVFNKLDDAQRIWVKGREFNLERLFGDAYPEDAKRFKGGALGIFRLAPQDYHRFHIPVDGVLGEPKQIDGEYYTVNPMAIRSALDVYGENIRICVPIDSTTHGRVMMVCVGAMMVGSTVITRQKGEQVKRAEELGYFKFGGSTVLVLFEPGQMVFDGDLHDNSNSALETLVRVGMSIGHTPTHAPHTPDMKKSNPTNEEKQEAKRRIEGSLAPTSGEKKPSLDTALKI